MLTIVRERIWFFKNYYYLQKITICCGILIFLEKDLDKLIIVFAFFVVNKIKWVYKFCM